MLRLDDIQPIKRLLNLAGASQAQQSINLGGFDNWGRFTCRFLLHDPGPEFYIPGISPSGMAGCLEHF
jgi:hypothetical protein